MNGLILLCTVAGSAMLIYFVICFTYAGLSASFTTSWLLLGIMMFVIRYILVFLVRHQVEVPRGVKFTVIGLVSLGILAFVYAEARIIYCANQSAPANVEYVIVLGARVKGTTITGSLEKRLNTAIEYLQENKESKVIVSGGQGEGEDITEAEAMYDYLVSHGIEESRITKEERSRNTSENIQFSREIIKNDHAKVAIVSNGFHIYRATSMAKVQGMTDVHGLAAPSDKIMLVSYYTREAIAVLKYTFTGQIN